MSRRTRQAWIVGCLIAWGTGAGLFAQSGPGEQEMRLGYRLARAGSFDSSIVHYQLGADLLESSPRRDLYYRCLTGIIDNLVRMTRFGRADSLARTTESAIRRELGERHNVTAEVYSLLGYLRTYQDQPDEAVGYYRRCLDIRQALFPDNHPLIASAQYGIGIAFLRKGALDSALANFLHARTIQESDTSERRVDQINTVIALGEVYEQLNEPSKAVQTFQEGLALLDRFNRNSSESAATNLHKLAVCYKELGQFDLSVEYERRALRIARSLYGNEHAAVAGIIGQLGDHLTIRGDFAAALECYGEAYAIDVRLLGKTHSSTLEFERKTARVYCLRGEYAKALEIYSRVLKIHEATFGAGNPELGFLCEEIGDAYDRSGNTGEALRYLGRALALRNVIGHSTERLDIGQLYLRLARTYDASGNSDTALTLLARSLALQDSSGRANESLKASTLELVGKINESRKRFADALQAYDQALAAVWPEAGDSTDARSSRHPRPGYALQSARLLAARARVLQVAGDGKASEPRNLIRALSSYGSAAAVMATIRGSYHSDGSKLALQGELRAILEPAVALGVRLYRMTGEKRFAEEAFAFAEMSKGAVLAEGLEKARPAALTGVSPRLREREKTLATALREVQNGLEMSRRNREERVTAQLRRQLLLLSEESDRLQDTLSDAANGDRRRYNAEALTLTSIQKTIAPGTCLIEYAVAGDRLFIFVAGHENFDVAQVDRIGRLDSAAREFRRSLRTMDRPAYTSTARELYGYLIQPIRRLLPADQHLVFVPDGSLNYIPFEAILLPPASHAPGALAESSYGALPYLLKAFDISYALSARIYSETRSATQVASADPPSFAGFAPVFRDSNASMPGAMRNYLTTIDAGESRSISLDGRNFRALPFSETEVRNIAGAFSSRAGKSLCVLNADATEGNFKANARGHSILHVATHGYIDEDNPAMSALIFAPDRNAKAADDGILYAGEVFGLDLHADLVVLSSCESGVGKLVQGEGLMAMTRGFLYSGAKNIVYSLWKIQDRHASELMQRFYGGVVRGKSYAASLRLAKLAMLRDEKTANPFKWAGFVLMGD